MVEGIGNLLEGREWGMGLIKTHMHVLNSQRIRRKDDQESALKEGKMMKNVMCICTHDFIERN